MLDDNNDHNRNGKALNENSLDRASDGAVPLKSSQDNVNGHNRNDGDNDGNENHSDEETLTLLYDTVFNRAPDAKGLATWTNELAKTGVQLNDLADTFMQSQEFTNLYGENLSDDAFIEALYSNSLGRASDDAGKAHWLEQLNSGTPRSEILTGFSESAEHVALTLTGTAAGIDTATQVNLA